MLSPDFGVGINRKGKVPPAFLGERTGSGRAF